MGVEAFEGELEEGGSVSWRLVLQYSGKYLRARSKVSVSRVAGALCLGGGGMKSSSLSRSNGSVGRVEVRLRRIDLNWERFWIGWNWVHGLTFTSKPEERRSDLEKTPQQ